MAKSGLTHTDVGPELTRTEWESEESHAIINGNAFPGSPVERQLFYRNDLHEWYIYNGSAWVNLQGAGGAGDMLKSVYDTGDDGVVDNSEKLEGSTKTEVQDHTPKAHTLASHSTKAHSELTGVTADQHHAKQHAITSTPDHTSSATPGRILKADANGLPVDATNTDTDVADAVTKKHTQNTDTDLSPAHKDAATGVHGVGGSTIESASGSQAKVNTHAALTTGVHGAGGNTLWHGGLTNIVDKTHLSQDFGASAGRLRNLIVTPIAGEIMRVTPCSSPSPFSAAINGSPTATSVVYDGDSNEGMFDGLQSSAFYWGRIVLHNTTRGNSRKIVDVNISTNTITTESSTDDWADDDVITVQSQTNAQAGYFDVDVSAEVGTTVDGIYLFATFDDLEGNQDNSRYMMFHPYAAYDQGKRQWINANLANIKGQGVYPIQIISQKFTMWLAAGIVSVSITLSVKAKFEYADT